MNIKNVILLLALFGFGCAAEVDDVGAWTGALCTQTDFDDAEYNNIHGSDVVAGNYIVEPALYDEINGTVEDYHSVLVDEELETHATIEYELYNPIIAIDDELTCVDQDAIIKASGVSLNIHQFYIQEDLVGIFLQWDEDYVVQLVEGGQFGSLPTDLPSGWDAAITHRDTSTTPDTFTYTQPDSVTMDEVYSAWWQGNNSAGNKHLRNSFKRLHWTMKNVEKDANRAFTIIVPDLPSYFLNQAIPMTDIDADVTVDFSAATIQCNFAGSAIDTTGSNGTITIIPPAATTGQACTF